MKLLLSAFLICFILPLTASAVWWSFIDRLGSWRTADWSSSGLLDEIGTDDAEIYVMAARTGGLKGAFSVHTWIVVKEVGASRYERWDKVGWGRPVRRNGYAADAYWYSNQPYVIGKLRGKEATTLIPRVRAAIDAYPFNDHGAYHIWPGPNSNSFVSHVLRAVPELGWNLPAHAVGKDFVDGSYFHASRDGYDFSVTFRGLVGFTVGVRAGLEVHLLGQSFGLDLLRPALNLPGIGRIGMAQ
ncbi:MAG: DUF3750 domain-containing protein [Pseudomonadota bacterium]